MSKSRFIMPPIRLGFTLAIISLFGLAHVAAGQTGTASIIGQVTDESGAVLPGVTVTATSPALQVGSATDVTNERGEYRLTPLPFGTYAVVYELSGFRTIRQEELRLTVGFIAKVDIVLQVGSLAESITVSGSSPVVDVTTTAVSTTLTAETLQYTPTSMTGLYSLAAQIPAVRMRSDVGGDLVVSSAQINVYGQVGDTWVIWEGVAIQTPKRETQGGGYYDYAAMEEVRTEVLASGPDSPRRGLKISVVTKSGGNNFHGGGFTTYTDGKFQSDNTTDALRAQGFSSDTRTRIVKRYDVNGELGGRVIRDKVWFFGSARRSRNEQIGLGATKPDGSPAVTPHMAQYWTAKLSYQASQKHRFVAFSNYYRKELENSPSQLSAYESRGTQNAQGTVNKIEWQWVPTSSLVINALYGEWHWGGWPCPNGQPGLYKSSYCVYNVDTGYGIPASRDIRTGQVWGSPAGAGAGRDEGRYHPHAEVIWNKPDLWRGNHDFKFGFDYYDARINPIQWDRGASGNYALQYDNEVAFQMTTVNYPAVSTNPVHHTAIYAGDSWSVSRRLTLNLGARFSRDNGFLPASCRDASSFAVAECYDKVQFPIWNAVSPRLNAAFDMFGDAKTVLKGGWGHYARMRDSDSIILADKRAPTTTTWRWRDLNNNKNYDPGEVNLDPNGPDFVSIAGTSNLIVNPDEGQEESDQFTVSLERELMPNFALRVTGLYERNTSLTRLRNIARYGQYNIPITQRDPGPDGVVNNADDPGTSVTYYDYPTALRGAQYTTTSYVTDPGLNRTFRTIEFGVTRRLTARWQMQGSYSATKKNIPFVFNAGGGKDYPILTDDPNAEINTADQTWDRQGQLSGLYRFPYGVNTSVNYRFQSGDPWGRTVLVRGGVAIPSFVVRVEPIGTRRLPNTHLVDLRFEKTVRLATNHSVSLQANIYNVKNSATAIAITDQSGVNFLKPTGGFSSILQPRILTLNATYRF